MAVIWNKFGKKYILSDRDIKSMFFLNCYDISFYYMQSLFEFLVSVINHYHINGLHLFLFWESFEWFCLQISRDAKYFSSLAQGIVIED